MKKIVAIFCILIFIPIAELLAHGGATGIVKERMDLMGSIEKAMKALAPVALGKVEYDIEEVQVNAEIIRDNAAQHMTKLFPEGSLQSPSESLMEIWEEWEIFDQLAQDLARLGQALYSAADQPQVDSQQNAFQSLFNDLVSDDESVSALSDADLAAMPVSEIFDRISDNCSDCHDRFRERK